QYKTLICKAYNSPEGLLLNDFYATNDLFVHSIISSITLPQSMVQLLVSPMLLPPGTDLYTRKYDPFIDMEGIRINSVRCSKIVDASQLDTDISNNQVPQFAYYVPNQIDDGHDTSFNYSMTWFQSWFDARRNNPSFTMNTLFIIVWACGVSNNHVPCILYGSPVNPPSNHQDNTNYSTYSIMSTAEVNWNLGSCKKN
ncbi:13741_t:CDS:2, partial [Cetraspora pellucida]